MLFAIVYLHRALDRFVNRSLACRTLQNRRIRISGTSAILERACGCSQMEKQNR